MSELARIMRYGQCHEGVSRKGDYQPCNKAAVAIRLDPNEEDSRYPVCAYHARGHMVPLRDILAGLMLELPEKPDLSGWDDLRGPVGWAEAVLYEHGGRTDAES